MTKEKGQGILTVRNDCHMGPEHHVAQAFLKQKKQKQATKQTNEKNKSKQKKKTLIVWIVTQSVNTNRIQVLTGQKATCI